MKQFYNRIIIIFLTVIFSQTAFSQYADTIFKQYQKVYENYANYHNLNCLFNKSFVKYENIRRYIIPHGEKSKKIISSPLSWITSYIGAINSCSSYTDKTKNYLSMWSKIGSKKTIPIGITFFEGNYLKNDTFIKYYDKSIKQVDIKAPYDKLNITEIANLKTTSNFKNVTFEIDSNFSLISSKDSIKSLSIDFGDGRGFVDYGIKPQIIHINYQYQGEKSIIYRLKTQNVLYEFNSMIEIFELNELTPDSFNYILPNGQITGGDYYVSLGCDQILNKPVVIVEGFQPFGSLDASEVNKKYHSCPSKVSIKRVVSLYSLRLQAIKKGIKSWGRWQSDLDIEHARVSVFISPGFV